MQIIQRLEGRNTKKEDEPMQIRIHNEGSSIGNVNRKVRGSYFVIKTNISYKINHPSNGNTKCCCHACEYICIL
jgi:DNA-directed RNA polymerase subunit L